MPLHSSTKAAPIAGGLCCTAAAAGTTLIVLGSHDGLPGLVTLAIFSALAFILGALISAVPHDPRLITRADAAAAGAMLTSALVLVVPHALIEHAEPGAIGLVAGLGIGLLLQRVASAHGGRSFLGALTLHSICDGLVLGALYTLAPALGWSVGLAILVHKAPAGYALARRLPSTPANRALILLPALGTGLGALSVAMMRTTVALPAGLIFGVAAGLFLFVALMFFGSVSGTKKSSLATADYIALILGGAVVIIAAWIAPHGV